MTRPTLALLFVVALLAFALRVYRLDDVPPGFFLDESSVGANARSLALTGHDLHGTRFPALVQALPGAHEDWKHPLAIYAAAASELVLGPTRFAVRLPAAILGALTVLLVGLLGFELTRDVRVAVAASFVLALMPWHIQDSRMIWEAVTLGFTVVLALWLWFAARRRRSRALFALAGAAAGLALYSYTPAKLLVPVFMATLAVLELKESRRVRALAARVQGVADSMPQPVFLASAAPTPVPEVQVTARDAALALVAFALVAAPMAWVQLEHWSEIQSRFRVISIWKEENPAAAFAKSYLAHLSFDFLFVSGDANPRHGWPGWGELLVATAPLCLAGLVRLALRRDLEDWLQLVWLLVYPLGAAFTSEAIPHASRAFLGAPLFALLAAQGVAALADRASSERARIAVVVVSLALVAGNAGLALRDYFVGYPTKNAAAWNEGLEALVHELEARRGSLRRVHFAPDSQVVPQDVLFFAVFDPNSFDPARPDPYYDFLPESTSVPRLLATLPRDEVVVNRWGREFQLGVAPASKFLDRSGEHGYAVYGTGAK